MKNEKSFFETIIDAISWLKIVASPTILGIGIGFACQYYLNSNFLFGFFVIAGIVLGIYWANKVSKKYGATNFISKVNASPDIDEAVKDKK
jgi:uncharacterized membrane protein YfcA